MSIDYFPDKNKLWKDMFDNLKYLFDHPKSISLYTQPQIEKLNKIINAGSSAPFIIRSLATYILHEYTLQTFEKNTKKLNNKYIDKNQDIKLKKHMDSSVKQSRLLINSIFLHRKNIILYSI